MADLNIYAAKLPTWEGKLGNFTETPNDLGGATNCGITLNTFIGYRRQMQLPTPTVDDLKNLSYTEWLAILKADFWDKWQGDLLENQSVAECCVEFLWGSGMQGIKIPQRLLGLIGDGIVGNATVAAVNAQNQQEFHAQLVNAKISFINQLILNHPEQEKFRNGWMRRINAFTFAP